MFSRKLYHIEINKCSSLYRLIIVLSLFYVGITHADISKEANYKTYLFKTSDALIRWSSIKIFSNSPVGISFINSKTGFVCGKDGSVFSTTNGGLNWTFKGFIGSIGDLSGISFTSDEIGYACNKNGNVSKTSNGGTSWRTIKIFSNSPVGMSFINSKTGFVCGKDGSVFSTTNGGLNWTFKGFIGSTGDLSGISFTSDEIGYVCNKNGSIFKTSNGGTSWRSIKIFSNSPVGISFINSKTGFVCGKNGSVFSTTNGGLNWTFKGFIGSIGDLSGISFTSDEIGYACNKNGNVSKTSNGG